ncbi:hypothetical protein PC129_g21781 [Phytophthora cactorum]|uniref:Uncharacterized protein n=1 Tax=Phytophthora cactorum TaxID=29920 RepID=A0A8T1H4Z2_9STRA|nr:hypothetical protein Pcac1_g15035 [Phytophthora cactorum]KAG2823076.1 hypothetical protein PC113_g22236 [Phytophthora cactorum]KAG2829131.1 hypothetical protein PC112_g8197 [Phytophthora cactorum]KAG2889401.1 hypothetical protein PC117_g24698 [Phytophthora cactorum]KAG2899053.1 hypothetical protein PC114_g14045 [Phytophthora cactorum]
MSWPQDWTNQWLQTKRREYSDGEEWVQDECVCPSLL